MRFTRFPHVEHPTAPSARRVARRAGRERPMPALSPARNPSTAEIRLAAIDKAPRRMVARATRFQGPTAWREARANSRRLK
jgi:hypothetical protein